MVDPDKIAVLSAAYAAVPRRRRVLDDRTQISAHLGLQDRGLFDDLSDMRDARYLVLTGGTDDAGIAVPGSIFELGFPPCHPIDTGNHVSEKT